jgi:hypothetical protein
MKQGEDFSRFIGALDNPNTVHRSLRYIPGLAIMGTAVTAVPVLIRWSDKRALLVCLRRST